MSKKLGQKREKPRLVKPAKWNAFVATPAYDGKVDTDYCQSLAEASFISPLFHVEVAQSVMGNGAFIELARNIFVKIFLEQMPDATHLFFIDADLKFPKEAFVGLIRSGHPVTCGVYPRRQTPEDYPIQLEEHPEQGGLWVEEDDSGSWIMAKRVPTGFLCIERSVVEEMAKDARKLDIHGQDGPVPELFYTKQEWNEESQAYKFVGEDYSFCDDYTKRYKRPIHVWPNIDFVHGGYKGNYLEYLDQLITQEEEAANG